MTACGGSVRHFENLLHCEGLTVAKVIVRSTSRVDGLCFSRHTHARVSIVLVQLMNEYSGRCWYAFDSVYALYVSAPLSLN